MTGDLDFPGFTAAQIKAGLTTPALDRRSLANLKRTVEAELERHNPKGENAMTRFHVVTSIPPALREIGFVAYVSDREHPDGSGDVSVCWCQDHRDADRVCVALSRMQGVGEGDSR